MSGEKLAALELEHRLALVEQQRDQLRALLDEATQALEFYGVVDGRDLKDDALYAGYPGRRARATLEKIKAQRGEK